MTRIFALSDLHVDHEVNMTRMLNLSDQDYKNDALIVAGDCTDSLDTLAALFESLSRKFKWLFFVPGNHELWIRKNQFSHSFEKFNAIIELCNQFHIHTRPFKVPVDSRPVWVVPLFSWYRKLEGDEYSLYIEKTSEDDSRFTWVDDRLCKWPENMSCASISDYFLSLNQINIHDNYDAPVISFSHFLPRRELMFGPLELAKLFADGTTTLTPFEGDPAPFFNFSRVAGCLKLEEQVRQLGSQMHVYGHQHRNRNRHIDGVTYVSHCLGNALEQQRLPASELTPRLIWDTNGPVKWADAM